jgi:membrane-bound lytic murein transglycosylase F
MNITIRRQKWRSLLFIFLVLSIAFFCPCARKSTLERIKETGQITVITRNNAHCYYIYRDEPMGFEYDLAKAFSGYLGVELKVITSHLERLFDMVNRGDGNFIAASMTITPSRGELVDFSDEYMTTQQRVIIHKSNYEIQRLEDLAGKTIHVRRATSYEGRLHELKGEGLDLNIELHVNVPTEELIRMVAEKEIEVTIADSHIALLNRRYDPDVKIGNPWDGL